MSFVQSKSQNRPSSVSFAAAAIFALSSAIVSSSAAVAAPESVSTRIEQRQAQPTTASLSPSSQITRLTALPKVKAMKRAEKLPVSTKPVTQRKELVRTEARVSERVRPVVATIQSTPATPLTAIIKPAPKATPAILTSRSKSAPLIATFEKPVAVSTPVKPVAAKTIAKGGDADQILLAQLESDLSSTQTRLTSTSQKLSAGQRQLMSFSNTLRSAIIEAGDDGAGLHPFVRVASRYAGTPYVWGGESRYGFDCSGFIIRVMRDLGYKALPHSAAEQFKYGQPIAQGLLKPGDIVFFANTYKPGISHVGIYIGKRKFIHAASTRQGTIVSSLDASPYRQKYAGARRLLTVKKKA